MNPYARSVSRKTTPQTEPIPGSAQVANSAGGYSFPVDDWTRLDRFLILGSEGGSYYAGERELTRENAAAVERCIATDGPRTIRRIVELSVAGRAPKNDPAIFALALALKIGDAPTRKAAGAEVAAVCRTGTHLFQLCETIEAIGGWGRGTRRALGAWYRSKVPDDLAYQLVKYRQRDGWTHRDVLRLSHPRAPTPGHETLFRWTVNPDQMGPRSIAAREYPAVDAALLPGIVGAYEEAKTADVSRLVKLIADHNLPREALPTERLTSPEVWDALLRAGHGMPLGALVRNLGAMTTRGLLAPMSDAARYVARRLTDEAGIKRARLHPLSILLALKVYADGHGLRGALGWEAVPLVVDALDAAFYLAFGTVSPSGKRQILALDVSGSMAGSFVAGTTLTSREAAAAMALVTARTEPETAIMAFSRELIPFPISDRERLDDVVQRASRIDFGDTDCALPMLWARKNRIKADAFAVYTDSETWFGQIHPVQALQVYRNEFATRAKLAVIGMVSNGFSIADPADGGMLDVVGFDTATPQVLADFIAND